LTEFDLRALLELLNQRGIRFVVIGGVAVAAHGYIRGTEDLDVVPDPDPTNLEKLVAVLNELEATLPNAKGRRFDPATDTRVVRQGGSVTADTKFGGLDVVQRAQGIPPYTQLDEDAVDSELLGIPVRVCSLSRLREMKAAQGRSQDQADLENLPES
jgi:predicted nucleotidyltransferase